MPTTTQTLSARFDVDAYHARPKDTIRWTATRSGRGCDECAALQHETRGQYGPRHPARQRRAITGGPDLLLCHTHADAWRTRDTYHLHP